MLLCPGKANRDALHAVILRCPSAAQTRTRASDVLFEAPVAFSGLEMRE